MPYTDIAVWGVLNRGRVAMRIDPFSRLTKDIVISDTKTKKLYSTKEVFGPEINLTNSVFILRNNKLIVAVGNYFYTMTFLSRKINKKTHI